MRWSPQQDEALSAVARWRKAASPQVFRLFGYAGTGKTTLARHIADQEDGPVVFAAYTGKAASVLRAKGAHDAGTIHSLIYRLEDDAEDEPRFRLNRSSPLAKASLAVIDECSMVDEALGRDLLSFGTPVLVLGDPAQLPPVSGGGFFTQGRPDVMLDEVHRQARENPIVRLSMIVREGGRLERGEYGESRVIGRGTIEAGAVVGADQVLVGRNATRRRYNARIRALLERTDILPQEGDRLVCLRNKPAKGLLNGSLWRVAARLGDSEAGIGLRLDAEEAGAARRETEVRVDPGWFTGEIEATAPPSRRVEAAAPSSRRMETGAPPSRREGEAFDYGYALTVHKAQGSQWDDVVLFDESFAFREHRARWLYTGITRAARRLVVVQ